MSGKGLTTHRRSRQPPRLVFAIMVGGSVQTGFGGAQLRRLRLSSTLGSRSCLELNFCGNVW